MTTEARRVLDEAVVEKDFQAAVVRLAKLCDWTAYHTHNSRHSEPGFPDLFLVKLRSDGDGWCIAAELKTETGQPTAEQYEWLHALRQVPGIEVFLWRPSDWPEIEARLKGERHA